MQLKKINVIVKGFNFNCIQSTDTKIIRKLHAQGQLLQKHSLGMCYLTLDC